jgi:hypothetical protein
LYYQICSIYINYWKGKKAQCCGIAAVTPNWLAATNRVTEQLNWLTVESFFMSCSISWMASLIDDNLLSSGFDSFGNQLTTCEL